MKYYFTLWINFRFSTLLFQQVLTANLTKLFLLVDSRRGPDLPNYRTFFQFHVFILKSGRKSPIGARFCEQSWIGH